ncbi:transposase, partial [Salibacterium aidingense]
MGEQRQQYSEAFKKDTVRYVQQHKQQKNITDIAEDLQIPRSALYEWMKQYREFDDEPVVDHQHVKDLERQLKAKEKELADKEEELAILKKTVHIF